MKRFFSRPCLAILMVGLASGGAGLVARAACNLPASDYPVVNSFTILEPGSSSSETVNGTANDNPGELYLCATTDKSISITLAGTSLDKVGWRIEKDTSAGTTCTDDGTTSGAALVDGTEASPTEANYGSVTTGTLMPAAGRRVYCVKLFCDGNEDGVKQGYEPYICHTDLDGTPEPEVYEIKVVVLKVELFRDVACTKVLDDWPETAGQLRSPKYIFGKEEGIYVRVTGPAGMGDSFFEARVASESATLASTLKLHETPAGSGKYVNKKTSVSRELRLGPSVSFGTDFVAIKVVEEEVLTFTILAGGADACTKDVMVDRGEFATATARSYDSRVTPPNGADRSPIWQVAADEFVSDINDWWEGNLDWWEVGYVRGTSNANNTAFAAFVKNAGGDEANNKQADLFYSHSHGESSGDLSGTKVSAADPAKDEWETIINAAGDLAGVWANDTDWVIIKACSVLQHTGTGRAKWEAALKIGRRAHGILSFEDPSASDYDGYVDDFLDEIGARHTLVTSWINGNTGLFVGDQPYGIVYHTENAADVLRKATEGISLTADVKNDNFTYAWRNASGTTGTDAKMSGSADTQELNIRWRGRLFRRSIPVHRIRGPLPLAHVRTSAFDVSKLQEGFDLVRQWDSGAIRLSRDLDLASRAISRQEAVDIAETFIAMRHLPTDADLYDAVPISVSNKSSSRAEAIGYALSFGHSTNGVEICGDIMKLIVQADGVKLFGGVWHEVVLDGSEGRRLSEFNATRLQKGVDWLSEKYDQLKELPEIRNVSPAYYVGDVAGDGAAIAHIVWRIQLSNGLYALLESDTSEVIDYFGHDKALRHKRR